MDLGAMRRWLKQHQELCMITERVYHTLMDEEMMDVVEFRLVMPRGDMDYTASVLIPKKQVDENRDAALQKAFDRLAWETERDTRIRIDCPHALENGSQYQHSR